MSNNWLVKEPYWAIFYVAFLIFPTFVIIMLFVISSEHVLINILRLRQNGGHFADNIFKYIFLNENVRIWMKISLKFVPKWTIHYIYVIISF